MPLPLEAIVHRAGKYIPAAISAKAAVMILAVAESNKYNWPDAFSVRKDAMRMAEKLSCNFDLTAKQKQSLSGACNARKWAVRDILFHSLGLRRFLSGSTVRRPEDMKRRH